MKHTKVWVVIVWLLLATVSLGARRDKTAAASNQDKETKTVVSGTLVNQKGLPVKDAALELYMVVEGVARDAYGNPLKGAINIGTNRQILSLMMFPVKTNTDAAGQYSLEMPGYFMVPSGLRLIGWTIVNIDASGKVHALNVKEEMLMIMPKPDDKKIELGKQTLSTAPFPES